jgi:predicted amidophosphoribosyltransferase
MASGYDIAGAHIVLIDDVMTTGATVHELARVLRHQRVAQITVAVLARGVGQ